MLSFRPATPSAIPAIDAARARRAALPSVAEIARTADLQKHWRLLRLYDSSLHAERVLEVIRKDRLDFQVMLGAHLAAEMNNFGCPWAAPTAKSSWMPTSRRTMPRSSASSRWPATTTTSFSRSPSARGDRRLDGHSCGRADDPARRRVKNEVPQP